MSSIFNGLHIGLKALQTQKKSLDVAGHNIANANNKEYSRQRAVQTATAPYPLPSLNSPGGAGQVGTGVKIADIERIRDEFIESQIREESQDLGKWDKLYQGLNRIELILNEPSDSGLNSALSRFWQSLQDLSNLPEDPATRSTVQQRAISLSDSFHSLNEQLTDYKKALNRDVATTVDNINSLSRRIADLNRQITAVTYSGQKPNDLMDKRDSLFKELNETVDVRGRIDQYGNLNISLGGTNLINKAEINELRVEDDIEAGNSNENKVLFKNTGKEVSINSGSLRGILITRNDTIDEYIDELDVLAQGLADKINEVHQQGYDLNGQPGGEFFVISDDSESASRDIRLSEAINSDPSKIAAGYVNDNPEVVSVDSVTTRSDYSYQITVSENEDPASEYLVTIKELSGDSEVIVEKDIEVDAGNSLTLSDVNSTFSADFTVMIEDTGTANLGWEQGSGDNAIRLADAIKKDKVIDGEASFTEYYESVISGLGVAGERAQQMQGSQETLVTQLNNQRESISGVSLDEEMTNIIKYQQAYNAASKIITTTEELLDNLMQVIR